MSFWGHVDKLVEQHPIVIDRPKGTAHPRFPDSIYPIDYGYLDGTVSGDGHGIDIWVGSEDSKQVQAIIVTIDLKQANSEIKLITGCTEAEIDTIYQYHCTFNQQGLLVTRS